jgi:hypothetical protein
VFAENEVSETNLPLARIDEAYVWLSKNSPVLLQQIEQNGPAMRFAVQTANKLGAGKTKLHEEEDDEAVSLAKAEFMSITAHSLRPVIGRSIREASKRANRARKFKTGASISTTVFSSLTLGILSTVIAMKAAQWTAIGSTISAFCALFADHTSRLGDGEKRVTAAQASEQLVDLDYELMIVLGELDARLRQGTSSTALISAINRANELCRRANSLSGMLGTLQAFNAE